MIIRRGCFRHRGKLTKLQSENGFGDVHKQQAFQVLFSAKGTENMHVCNFAANFAAMTKRMNELEKSLISV